MSAGLPERVRIVEVGPRDGLQNEPDPIPTTDKLAFINALADAGLRDIEVTSFVSPQRVPQLADADDVARRLPRRPGVVYSALVPNRRGLERALAASESATPVAGTVISRIAVFTAASETFTQKNIGTSIAQSLETFADVVAAARAHGLTARGYVSTCFVCPYEGDVPREKVREVAEALLSLGVDEVAISDTLGAAAPRDVQHTVGYLLQTIPREKMALHFHDTCGTALANVVAGLQLGIETFDSSAGGLGGCPYAPGASGNLATEDLVYLLDRMGFHCGVSLERVAAASRRIEAALGRTLPSRQLQRLRSARETKKS